jgi:hypothetical protein
VEYGGVDRNGRMNRMVRIFEHNNGNTTDTACVSFFTRFEPFRAFN